MPIRKFQRLLRYYRFHKLLAHNFWICLLSLVIPMMVFSAVGLFMYYGFLRDAERVKYTDMLTAQINSIDLLLANVEKTVVELNAKKSVSMFISDRHEKSADNASPPYYSYRIMKEVVEYLVFAVQSNSMYINSIYLYSTRNNYVLSNAFSGSYDRFFLDVGVFDAYIAAAGKPETSYVLRSPRGRYVSATFPSPVFITLFKRVFGSFEEQHGVIAVNIKLDYVNDIINKPDRAAGQNTFVFTGHENTVIGPVDTVLSPERVSLLTQSANGDYRRVSYIGNDGKKNESVLLTLRSDYNGWLYVMEIPQRLFNDTMLRFIPVIAALFVVIVITAAVIAALLSYTLFKPIGDILSILEDSDNGTGNFFITNEMYSAYADLQSIQGQLAARVSRLNIEQVRSLQAQINPHFIFNTLQAIRWEVVRLTGGENDVSGMIDRLSEMTRELIGVNTLIVTVKQEILYAERYLKIMRMRYRSGFTVHWDVQDDCLDAPIPKIILQPLIENAIHHGIRGMDADGCVDVVIRANGENITVSVSDNGPGLSDARLAELHREYASPLSNKTQHIGLTNVHHRLKLIYGHTAGIVIERNDGAGCRVSLSVPRTAPHGDSCRNL